MVRPLKEQKLLESSIEVSRSAWEGVGDALLLFHDHCGHSVCHSGLIILLTGELLGDLAASPGLGAQTYLWDKWKLSLPFLY